MDSEAVKRKHAGIVAVTLLLMMELFGCSMACAGGVDDAYQEPYACESELDSGLWKKFSTRFGVVSAKRIVKAFEEVITFPDNRPKYERTRSAEYDVLGRLVRYTNHIGRWEYKWEGARLVEERAFETVRTRVGVVKGYRPDLTTAYLYDGRGHLYAKRSVSHKNASTELGYIYRLVHESGMIEVCLVHRATEPQGFATVQLVEWDAQHRPHHSEWKTNVSIPAIGDEQILALMARFAQSRSIVGGGDPVIVKTAYATVGGNIQAVGPYRNGKSIATYNQQGWPIETQELRLDGQPYELSTYEYEIDIYGNWTKLTHRTRKLDEQSKGEWGEWVTDYVTERRITYR